MPNISKAKKIIENERFKRNMAIIKEAERDRIYCGHDLDHLLSVARIGMIIIHEQNLNISEDEMYGAALLHDIGRAAEYEEGTPHHMASVDEAKVILAEAGYRNEETVQILAAIALHRMSREMKQAPEATTLVHVLYEADKKSRACYDCDARSTCKWDRDEMNMELII